ncbi:hypothetical protein HOLDEFILI_00910 [Holdemania filiformis DSM 12042]|uniref:Uncharacterized protein n=1 Tax=Holdemania filiformis DSM 12042 TaxID=545696 RepID=B9Y529_9FIRM|nr:hypothetical protein HOLDEFILI_00910 [Holdemania filiformis DSM 12042]
MDFLPHVHLYFKDCFPFSDFIGKMKVEISKPYEEKFDLPYHSKRKLKVKA